jgi:hypothetical protein
MPRGLDAPLSPNEEVTLRRVALGRSPLRELAPRDVMRLKTLSLVEDENGVLKLTEIGRQRYRTLPRLGSDKGGEKSV